MNKMIKGEVYLICPNCHNRFRTGEDFRFGPLINHSRDFEKGMGLDRIEQPAVKLEVDGDRKLWVYART
jgi:hypothetical protein